MRRQPKSRKDQQALLTQESAPMLSDDFSEKTADTESISKSKKAGWRSRLFGSGGNRSTGRAVSASRSNSRQAPRNGTMSVSRASQSAAPDLVQVSSSSSSGPERPSRHSAPLRRRPDHGGEEPHQRKVVPTPAPASVPAVPTAAPSPPAATISKQATTALRRTQSNQSHTRHNQKSTSHGASEKNDRVKLTLSISESRSPTAPTGAVAKVLKRPFGREIVRPQDQTVRKLCCPIGGT